MEIVSVSVSPQTKLRMEEAMRASGCRSRSKLVSMAVESLAREFAPLESLAGNQAAVITVVSGEKSFHVHHIAHAYPGLVKLNTHLDSKKGCAEILVVEGDAQKILSLYKEIKAAKEVKSASLALT